MVSNRRPLRRPWRSWSLFALCCWALIWGADCWRTRETKQKQYNGNWIGAVIQKAYDGTLSRSSSGKRYAEGSVQDFLMDKGKAGARYVGVIEELGMTDWQRIEESYESNHYYILEAMWICRSLFREARLRAHAQEIASGASIEFRAPASGGAASEGKENDDTHDDELADKLEHMEAHLLTQLAALKKELMAVHRLDLEEVSKLRGQPAPAAAAAAAASGAGDEATPKEEALGVEASADPAPSAAASTTFAPADAPTAASFSASAPFAPHEHFKVPYSTHRYTEEGGSSGAGAGPGAGPPPIIQIKGVEDLAQAAAAAHDRGRLLLVTTQGLNWALTALNAVWFLAQYGFHGVLAVLSSEAECRHFVEQTAVPVKSCAWVALPGKDIAKAHSWPGNRLLWFEQLARMGYKVLMADTDICYAMDPFPGLDATGDTIVTSGPLGGYNLGVLYANGRNPKGTEDLGLLTEVNVRLNDFMAEYNACLAAQQVDGGSGDCYFSKFALNDQNLVNDVVHQWVTKKPIYARSCALAKLPPGKCFSHCCDPDQVALADSEKFAQIVQDDHAWYERQREAQNTSTLVDLSQLGHCLFPQLPHIDRSGPFSTECRAVQPKFVKDPEADKRGEDFLGRYCDRFGVVHMNTCGQRGQWYPEEGYNRSDWLHAGAHNHFQWLRENCWAPGLTALAKEWVVECGTQQCKEQHPELPVGAADVTAYDRF